EPAERPEAGPEVMAPFGNAVRFIDCEERREELAALQLFGNPLETLGRDIEKAGAAAGYGVEGGGDLGARHGPGQAHGRNSAGQRGRHLVLHQGNEWGDDQRVSAYDHGGHLKADGLSPTGREDAQCVPAGQHRSDDGALLRTEAGKTEVAVEDLAGRLIAREHGRVWEDPVLDASSRQREPEHFEAEMPGARSQVPRAPGMTTPPDQPIGPPCRPQWNVTPTPNTSMLMDPPS